jgi:eukaryotic-like serine/threonine-protein kinase
VNAFAALHLGLASVCVVMAGLHGAMWLAVRTEVAHRWVTLSFVGFAALSLGIAGSSTASTGSLGPSQPWLALTFPTALLLPMALARTAWAVLDRPMTPLRRRLLAVIVTATLPLSVQIAWYLLSGHPASESYEASRQAVPVVAIAYSAALLLVAAVWVVEGLRAIPTLGTLGWATVSATLPSGLVAVRETFILLGGGEGPTLVAFVGLPLALIASVSLVIRYVRALRQSSTRDPSGDYRRMTRLGAGGMGEVWLALRSGVGGFQRWVVLKKIRFPNPRAIERFLTEARVAARLHHPNIVAVYDLGRYEDGWYIVMEYLPGPSIHEILEHCYEAQIDPPAALVAQIGEQVCRGLSCAHGHGVLHRDISPDNVIVTFDGVAKLLDFGIAKDVAAGSTEGPASGDRGKGVTQPGGIPGKIRYLAPERIGGAPATIASDIFSLGLVLAQLMGASIPERGADLAGAPDPISRDRTCSPALEAVIRQALAARPEERWSSAEAMADALRPIAADPTSAELSVWVRTLAPERWNALRALVALTDPSPADVSALLARSYPPTEPRAVPSEDPFGDASVTI